MASSPIDKCVENAGQCGAHGTCEYNACKCSGGYTGAQCEISPTSTWPSLLLLLYGVMQT